MSFWNDQSIARKITRMNLTVCGIALASSRLGACLNLIPADHAQEHGQSKNWPATLIGMNKLI